MGWEDLTKRPGERMNVVARKPAKAVLAGLGGWMV